MRKIVERTFADMIKPQTDEILQADDKADEDVVTYVLGSMEHMAPNRPIVLRSAKKDYGEDDEKYDADLDKRRKDFWENGFISRMEETLSGGIEGIPVVVFLLM